MKFDDPMVALFMASCMEQLEKHDVSLHLHPERLISWGETKFAGWFDSDVKELHCAVGKPLEEWLHIFVHESCHFDQWREGSPAWSVLDIGDDSADLIILRWFAQDGTVDDVLGLRAVLAVMACEIDCERRTYRKIIQHNLTHIIDIDSFCRAANAYIALHEAALITRRWYVDDPPHADPAILALFPTTIVDPPHSREAVQVICDRIEAEHRLLKERSADL